MKKETYFVRIIEDQEKVVHEFPESTEELQDLLSTQDEADTRLWLHVHDAAERFGTKTAIIWSPRYRCFGIRNSFQDVLRSSVFVEKLV